MKDNEIKTQESEWVPKSSQLASNRAGIQAQGSLLESMMFLIYSLAREHSLPRNCQGLKENIPLILESSGPKLLLHFVCEGVFNFSFKFGRHFLIQETIKFGFKHQLMHWDKEPQRTAGERESLPGEAFILEVIVYFTWLWLFGMRSLEKGLLNFTSLSIQWCGLGLCVSRGGDIYLNREWRVDEP